MSLDINLTGVEKTSNKKTTLTDNSDTFYPTQKAVKTAVDAKFNTPTGTTAQYLRGDGTTATFPTIPDPADFVEKSDFTSHSILAKQSGASDPVAVSIGNNEILGRKSGGGSNIEGLSVSEVKSLLNYTASDVGAVATNSAITGATKTKITYDAKGLVTAGADATTADIADSSNKRYVTDANLTVIGNTSNTNTGDETKSTINTKLGATDWVDYSATSTVDGWTAFTEKIIAYKMLDAHTMNVFVRIAGTGNSSVNIPRVTLPMDGDMFGVQQYGTTGTGTDNGVSVITSHILENGDNELKFYKRSTTGAVTGFTGAGSRLVVMSIILKVA
jgi:hypothetical protein